MDLSKILSISGKPGLYKMVGQTKTGAIVESLSDNKRFPAFASERISSLEEISIFTNDEDMALKDVLKAIYDKTDGQKAIDHKSKPEELKEFFEEVIPDYDQERVYISDIKKVINWYNLLFDYDILEFSDDESDAETEESDKIDDKKDTGESENNNDEEENS
jgi:hypothetical protein